MERIARTHTQIYSEQNANGQKTQWKMKREPSQPTRREQCMERFELFKTENNDAKSEQNNSDGNGKNFRFQCERARVE